MLAFDGTYLTRRLSQVCLHGKRALIGGAWSPDQDGHCFKLLDQEQSYNVKEIPKATTLCEFLTWDMSARKKVCLSACCMPMPSKVEGASGTFRSSWSMMETVGQVLAADGGACVKGIVFDAATSHSLVRRALHGDVDSLDPETLHNIPFFGALQYTDLPPHPLPRLPIKFARVGNDIVWGLPDAEIVISTSSANALALVPDLETWTVQPTLRRGAKRKAPGSGPFAQKVVRARKKALSGPKAKKNTRKKKTIEEEQSEEIGLGDKFTYGPMDFKRTAEGKANTSKCFRQIYELDMQIWPDSRCFDADGRCRLKNVPAITVDQVIQHVPGCCSAMLLS
eukprot:Skav214989  [mRNA]  locus=scaffold508:314502:319550:+ [translate_table: standard]